MVVGAWNYRSNWMLVKKCAETGLFYYNTQFNSGWLKWWYFSFVQRFCVQRYKWIVLVCVIILCSRQFPPDVLEELNQCAQHIYYSRNNLELSISSYRWNWRTFELCYLFKYKWHGFTCVIHKGTCQLFVANPTTV